MDGSGLDMHVDAMLWNGNVGRLVLDEEEKENKKKTERGSTS